MGKKLFALFTVVPLIELALLLVLGNLMGLPATLVWVLTTALAGAYLAKREGLRVLRRWQESIAEGTLPADGILGGVLVLVGGVLLITPGVLTDTIGILLLIPPSRRWIAVRVKRHLESRLATLTTSSIAPGFTKTGNGDLRGFAGFPGEVIDVEGNPLD